jgi:hypothetical protein
MYDVYCGGKKIAEDVTYREALPYLERCRDAEIRPNTEFNVATNRVVFSSLMLLGCAVGGFAIVILACIL